jgi:inorganic triphosphatase YgiF
MLLVEIVANNAKFHSSQDKTNPSIVVTVSRNINHKIEEGDLVEEAQVAEDSAEEVDLAEEVALTEDHEKCTKQLVEIVVRNVKFHFSQKETSQSIAANAFKVIKEIKDNYSSCFIRS